jgi:glycosyltransferase involved in cell wall biosynthesis
MSKSKKRKVIHYYTRTYSSYFPDDSSPAYFLAGWSSRVAKQVLKYTDKYIVENWRFEKEIRQPGRKIIENVTCRLFPAKHYPIIGLFSRNLIRKLKEEIQENEVLLHLHTAHNIQAYLFGYIFRHLPIVISNYGSSPPIYSYREKKKLKFLVYSFIEKKVLKFFDFFFPTGKDEIEYLSLFVDLNKISPTIGVGIVFDDVKPINKMKARKKLGIPYDKKVIVYIGKFYKLKGVDLIINTFDELKQKYDVKLILLGGYPEDPLYKEAVDSGAEIHFRFEKDLSIPLYLSAADVYLILVNSHTNFLRFGGIGIASIEAMACGTPVVSFSLKHFTSEKDLKWVGKIPKSPKEITACVSEIFNNSEPYKKSRNIAEKYYDWSNISMQIIDVYDKLFKIYYD